VAGYLVLEMERGIRTSVRDEDGGRLVRREGRLKRRCGARRVYVSGVGVGKGKRIADYCRYIG
jgi:hypothetical protein